MQRRRNICLLYLILAEIAIQSSVISAVDCDLYIAESTIPNAGYGVFTAVDKKLGDTIGNGDVAFCMTDQYWQNQVGNGFVYVDPWEDYVWDGRTMGMGMEALETATLWPGLDAAINCMIPLENVHRAFPRHESHGDFDEDPYLLPHRSRHPAAGSITTYRSGRTTVIRDIPAGGELFKSYGDEWFTTRPHYFDENLPLTDNFQEAQLLLERFRTLDYDPLFDTLLDIKAIWEETSRTLNAWPSDREQLKVASETEDVTHIYQKNATRSMEWLQQHGTCIDHIVSGKSTIPGIGEGAFAKRALPKDTVVTGSPMMLIPDRSLLDVFDKLNFEETSDRGKPPLTSQVILNYCLGHEDSTMLLFPYASVGSAYINHSKEKANVKFRWARDGHLRQNDISLFLSPARLRELEAKPSLGMEFVALRGIEEGEELFLDYGDKWQEAWQKHVSQWVPPEEGSTAADWNHRSDVAIRTQEEQGNDPYPSNIVMRCHVDLLNFEDEDSQSGWQRYGFHEDEYLEIYGLPCSVIERSGDNTTYTVHIWDDEFVFFEVEWKAPEEMRKNVPRQALFFVDAPYKSDLFLPNAFRMPIQIPDDIFPDIWKNLKSKADETANKRKDEL